MGMIFAVAGKGGTGKTTTTALIVRSLFMMQRTPILAVDADPNANLADSLGISLDNSIGSVLSDFLRDRGAIPPGLTKQAYLTMKLEQILYEGKGIDMLAMGTPDGPGCYCAANAMLKDYFDALAKNYASVVIDNEAGMEHFSRKTTGAIDVLLYCSDYSRKGLMTVGRLSRMVSELKLTIGRQYLLVNRAPEVLEPAFLSAIEELGIPCIGHIPNDPAIEDAEINHRSFLDLPDQSPAVQRISIIIQKILYI